MVDVARLAGVSHQTVSRVINGSDKVRPETVERVRQAIKELGYRPNTAARALVTRKSGVIGIVNPTSADYGPAQMQLAIEIAARDNGYSAFISPVAAHNADDLRVALEHALAVDVEGLVVIIPREDMARGIRKDMFSVPVIAVTSPAAAERLGAVQAGHDQKAGMRALVECLIKLGHRNIAHVAGPLDAHEAVERLETWQEVLTEHDLPVPKPIHADWSAESGQLAARVLLERGVPDAVVAPNDDVALGIIHEFLAEGIRIPEDVSVSGFDDIPLSEFFTPALTTVRQDFQLLGSKIMRELSAQIRGEGMSNVQDITITPKLIERGSVGPAPKRKKR